MQAITRIETFRLPLPPSTLTGNARSRAASKRGEWSDAAEYRRTVKLLARSAWAYRGESAFTEPVRMALVFQVARSDRRDLTGLIECFKPGLDGLVDAGVLVNDSKRWVPEVEATWCYAPRGEDAAVIVCLRPYADSVGQPTTIQKEALP